MIPHHHDKNAMDIFFIAHHTADEHEHAHDDEHHHHEHHHHEGKQENKKSHKHSFPAHEHTIASDEYRFSRLTVESEMPKPISSIILCTFLTNHLTDHPPEKGKHNYPEKHFLISLYFLPGAIGLRAPPPFA